MLRKTLKSQYSAYDVYSTTPQGQQLLRGLASASPPPLMLPVPASVREEDRKAQSAADRVKADVEAARKGLAERGVNLAEVPEAELQPNAEQTPVTTAILHYFRQLEQWRASGKPEKAEAHEALHSSVVTWRAAEAKRTPQRAPTPDEEAPVRPATHTCALRLGQGWAWRRAPSLPTTWR